LPQARRERGLRAIAVARKALAAQTSAGTDPRGSVEAGRKRGESNADHHRRNREWAKAHPEQGVTPRDRAWFLREITPKLDGFSLTEIARATGFSLAACSRFRAGARVPHPRHWDLFAALVQDGMA